MEVSIKKLALVSGLSLGLLALPVAHGEGENDGMTVLMNGNFVTADPENIKWGPNNSVPYGMSMVLLYGNPSQFWIQTAAVLLVAVFSLVAGFVLLKLVDAVLTLRVSEHEERVGLDLAMHREAAYTVID